MAAQSVGMSLTATLVAATADTITFSGADPRPPVEIINLDASTVIWARIDGSAAVAEAAANVPIPGNSSWKVPGLPETISLISAGTPKYTVNRIV